LKFFRKKVLRNFRFLLKISIFAVRNEKRTEDKHLRD